MFMPFVRLIAIYIVVGLAIFAFFKRDAVLALIKGPEVEAAAVETPTPSPTVTMAPEPAPLTQPVAASAEPELSQPVASAPVFASADPTKTTPLNADTMMTRWAEARQSFWDGNSDETVTLYEALASDFPNEAGIVGELGNLYYNAGRTAEAATQFHTVGLIAVATGNKAEAAAMINILQAIAPDLATDLKARADANN